MTGRVNWRVSERERAGVSERLSERDWGRVNE